MLYAFSFAGLKSNKTYPGKGSFGPQPGLLAVKKRPRVDCIAHIGNTKTYIYVRQKNTKTRPPILDDKVI